MAFQGVSPDPAERWRNGVRFERATISPVQHSGFRKLFVAAMLALCVGIYALEFSGHWDRSIQEANDEAGIVAVVLCIGATLFAVGTLLQRIPRSQVDSWFVTAESTPLFDTLLVIRPISTDSPPISLRV